MEDVELHKNLLYLQSNDLDMRKFIAAIILLLMPFVSFGRMNKDINGLELGTTNLYDAVTLLKSFDKDCIYYESNGKIEASAHNFPFAGINWDTIISSFENGQLVRLQMDANNYPLTQFGKLFKDLNNAFLSKYEDFLVYSSATACMYKDEHVRILLSYDEAHSTITLTYTYEYKPKIGEGI